MSLFWRLSARLAGIKNPKSQADYMKEEILLKAKIMICDTLLRKRILDKSQ